MDILVRMQNNSAVGGIYVQSTGSERLTLAIAAINYRYTHMQLCLYASSRHISSPCV